MPELTMPRLSDTMQEGTLARWLKKPGDPIEKGEVVAEIETDKATMELESYDSGVLEKILVEEGQTVPIGQTIAVVGTGEPAAGGGTGEPAAVGGRQSAEATTAEEPAEREVGPEPEGSAEPAARASAAEDEENARAAADEPPADRLDAPSVHGTPVSEPAEGRDQPATPPARPAESEPAAGSRPSAAGAEQPSAGDDVKASPMARAIARERGIDLRTIQGSGPGGRVIRADVEAAIGADGRAAAPAPAAQPAAPAPAAEPEPAPAARRPAPAAGDVEEIPLTSIRRVVARRMLESVQSTPHFYLTSVVDAEALVAFREQVNEQIASRGDDVKISLNDVLVKACATALRANPDVNVSFAGDKILRYRWVNVGIAVALEAGLVVPVIRDADQKSLSQISQEAKALIEKARAGKLIPDDYSGGTFTISNLGMFGVDHFTAVINPPEAAILAVGATTPEVVARDGQPVVRQTMKLTLSIDHRALDGATAARFLQQLKAILEAPLRIVV